MFILELSKTAFSMIRSHRFQTGCFQNILQFCNCNIFIIILFDYSNKNNKNMGKWVRVNLKVTNNGTLYNTYL